MSNIKNLTGTRIGKLTLLERKRENKRTFYYCKCECGNEKWIRADGLKNTRSCGCLAKETQFKKENLKNKKFNRLTVIEEVGRDKLNGSIIWKCKCDCGNIKEVSAHNLKNNSIQSCGCLQREIRIKNGKSVGALHVKNKIIEDTNIQVLLNKKLMAHNTSGHTGVKWDSERYKWVAEIIFKNKNFYLGRFEKKEDAIKARKEAEERLHKQFLKEKGLIE